MTHDKAEVRASIKAKKEAGEGAEQRPNNNKDTKLYMSSLLVYKRVYRLEI